LGFQAHAMKNFFLQRKDMKFLDMEFLKREKKDKIKTEATGTSVEWHLIQAKTPDNQ
jgi:hypothetical protein